MSLFNYKVRPPILPVNQGNTDLCWLAATTVMFQWKDTIKLSMQDCASRLDSIFVAKFLAHEALSYDDILLWKSHGGFDAQGQQCLDAGGWQTLLELHGPLITLLDGTGGGTINHAVVVYGVNGDGSLDGTSLMVANSQTGVAENKSRIYSAQR